MSSEVSVRNRVSGGLARSAQPDVGADSSVHDATFTTRALSFEEDMPSAFRPRTSTSTAITVKDKAAGALVPADQVRPPRTEQETRRIAKETIASGVRQLDKPRRNGERIVQRRIGWQATPSLIVLATVERDLAPAGDGRRMKPSGAWQIEQRTTYPCTTGKAEKRSGQVPLDPPATTDQADTESAQPGAQEAVRQQFPEGSDALSYLPRAVRATVVNFVPTPTAFDGSVLRCSTNDGTLLHHEVNLLRMSAHRAVVVQAKLLANAQQWEVTQASYDLGTPQVEQP